MRNKVVDILLGWMTKFTLKITASKDGERGVFITAKAPTLGEHITEETGGYEKASD